jgi:ectoine hydroxylase-related dioxygenase (phytanoyl-CoA dioxygenase family)
MVDGSADVDLDRFAIVPTLLNPEELTSLAQALSVVQHEEGVRKRGGVYAIRNLLDVAPAVAELAASPKINVIVQSALGESAFPVRGTLFDKTPDANWLVPWHQDLTISVKERVDVEGYGPWTVKAGVQHVQPPARILEGMLAVRIHLDDCHERNGALRVLPATHRRGRLTAEQIGFFHNDIAPFLCSVNRGGVVLMKPLLLHASSAAQEPSHRRVIHIDYASARLPAGLSWFTDVDRSHTSRGNLALDRPNSSNSIPET